MKKILIASYYFPPCSMISAQRAKSFADNFHKFGLHPVIVTRHWCGDEISAADYESENRAAPRVTEQANFTLIELPYIATLKKSYHRALLKSRAGKMLLYTALYSIGAVNPKCDAFSFYDFLKIYLRENPVDYIFATGFPMNTIKLGAFLAQTFDKPLIADFRDLWDNNLLAENYQPPPAVHLQNSFYEFYLRRWLKPARLVTSVSQPLADEVKKLAPHAETLVVTNGFESGLFAAAAQKSIPPSDKFVFSVIGTLHPAQDLSVMLNGLKLFLADKNLREIELNFIGTAAIEAVKTLIEINLPPECTNLVNRIPRHEAIAKMCASHVLFHVGWRGHRGIASGKIYEYLGARRSVLIAPNDKDVMEKIVTETNAGKLADTPAEFAEIMNHWFREWKTTGEVAYHGSLAKIENYSRETQAEKLAAAISSLE